jgi:hypothetical protein
VETVIEGREENAMEKMKIVAPVGEILDADEDLEMRIKNVPRGAPVNTYFKEIVAWEKAAISKHKEAEQKSKSCKLEPRSYIS